MMRQVCYVERSKKRREAVRLELGPLSWGNCCVCTTHHKYLHCLVYVLRTTSTCTALCMYYAPQVLALPCVCTTHHKYLHCLVYVLRTTSTCTALCMYYAPQVLALPCINLGMHCDHANSRARSVLKYLVFGKTYQVNEYLTVFFFFFHPFYFPVFVSFCFFLLCFFLCFFLTIDYRVSSNIFVSPLLLKFKFLSTNLISKGTCIFHYQLYKRYLRCGPWRLLHAN